MIFFCLFVFYVLFYGSYGVIFGPQPRILSQNGHLILYAAEHKNISFQTRGSGGIQINGIDITKAAQISNNALQAMKKYQANFDTSYEKISKFERLLDDGLMEKIITLQSNSSSTSELPVNIAALVQSNRRLNRRVNNLQTALTLVTTLLTKNECSTNSCKNAGTCQDMFNNFICHCPPEWEGEFCDKDVNECARFAGTDLGCQNGATCINRQGSYECVCSNGWFGLHCTRRSVDCKSGSSTELCGHGTCVTEYEGIGYKCICDQGWSTDGKTPACNTDVNECAMGKPPCSVNPPVQCINTLGSFQCGQCPQGYTGNGYYCTDIDECATPNNGGCSTNPMVQCINTLSSRICGSCPPGYVGDGVICSYQGVCSTNNGGCHQLATCRSNPRISTTFVECVCPSGYVGNGIGPSGCVRSLQGPCYPNPCIHGACVANSTTDYTCQCYTRYTGRNCDSFKDLCATNPCQNGATCISYLGLSYRCNCPAAFTGWRCDTERQVCGGTLTTESGVLSFPSDPSQTYGHALSCAWTIETNTSKILNITFSRFQLEQSRACRSDWLQIHDGKNLLSPSLGRFCGNQLPNDGNILSTQNTVYLLFKSDYSYSYGGFNLTWTSVVPFCGDLLKEVTTHGSINSPGSPKNYANNRDCYWPLQVRPGKRLVFHFFSLTIGNSSNCNGDYLEFISGTQYSDSVFAKYCNTTQPTPLFSPGAEVLIHVHSDSKDTYPGFQITYAVTEGTPGCGGVYTRYQDEIRSPPYNRQYPSNIQCEYRIELPETSRIKITFLSLRIEYHSNCLFDYVAIYAGGTVDAPLIGKYCGSNLPSPYLTQNNKLLIVFTTDSSRNGDGFVLKYETVCGGKFTELSGIITSPGYPNTYTHFLQCIYEIEQPAGKVIELKIEDLDLENNTYNDCSFNFLEVRDGFEVNATLIGRYCNTIPPLIISKYNYLWIKFQSDIRKSGRGFKANYTTNDLGCGGILKKTFGTISTPNYPEMYPSNPICRWIVLAAPGNVIQITWINFQIGSASNKCSYNYVEIFDNNTETGKGDSSGKLCGNKNPPTFLSTSNLVTMTFHSDRFQNRLGFLATYNIIRESNMCGGHYYSSAGFLKSPRYPDQYPSNIDCIWTIDVQTGHQILLTSTDFSLRYHPNCAFDFLEIRSGGNEASPLLGKYCGITIPMQIPSHANKLYLHFHSNMITSGRGFNIKWESTATGCGGLLNSPSGFIISPNYPEEYTVNTECIWKIIVNTGSVIELVFSDLDLEQHPSCALDYVEILDGPSRNSKSLGRFCSSNAPFIQSTSNTATVVFRSDLGSNGRGFRLQYRTRCNNTLTGFRGVIESPNFPNSYPDSLNCNWQIEVAIGNKINLTFSQFNIKLPTSRHGPENASCTDNSLEVLYATYEDYFSFKKYGMYCEIEVPPLISLNSSRVQIHFLTNFLLDGNGFRLEWQMDGCGDILTEPSGNISSPNYPKVYPPNIECNWKIQTDYGKHIEITFHEVDLEKLSDCAIDYIKLYNGGDDSYPEIATICHKHKPITLRSSGNIMYIKFETDSTVEGKGFFANYSSKPTKCGGKYTADQAKIMSPNYPQNYEVNDTCGYEIEISEGHIISLIVVDFDLYSNEYISCSNNNDSYVKIYDGPTRDYAVLAKICGKNAPNNTLTSTTNKVYIEMITRTDSVAKGFMIKYQKSCGARIETDGSGIIRVNPHDIDYNFQNCSWTIVSQDTTKHVSLTVTHLEMDFCDLDSNALKVFNGESTSAPVLGSYCGPKIPPTLTSDGSTMHISIKPDTKFYATYSVYDSHCGGTLTSTEGYFASPGYPKKYPMETECEWIIDVTEGNHISLSFTQFGLLQSDHCNTDYLEIRQNNSTGKLLGIFCGDSLPTNITNLGSLWIFLKTSRVEGALTGITAKGFQAEYILCRTNELNGVSGRIVSPLYEQGFTYNDVDFTWKISVNFGKQILLMFKEIYLVKSGDSCYCSIKVYDGDDDTAPLLDEFCGTVVPKDTKSTSNAMYLKLSGYSPSTYAARFIVEWIQLDVNPPAQPTSKSNVCGTTEPINLNQRKNYTLITSPGFPNGYAPNLKCEWILTTIPMNRLRITFSEMDLGPSYGYTCYTDYVEVLEKKIDSDWTSVLTTCHENITSKPYTYNTNMMKMVFVSNGYDNGTGFRAYVREACGGVLTDSSDYIIYDNNTRVGYEFANIADCQWNITVGVGKTIEITFLEFNIHHDKDQGCNVYLLIRNGKFPESPLLGNGKYCGHQIPAPLKTTGNNAYIKYEGAPTLANFKLRYREVSYACGANIKLTQFDNVIELNSPNYPQIPPLHIECLWKISAPPGEIIRIDFPYRFDMASKNKNCTKEYVEIRDGGTVYSALIGKFCDKKPNSQFSSDNMMFVKFFTQAEEPGNGFKARLSLTNCGGTIHSTTGQIQSPSFNQRSKYPLGANCTWHLVAPPDHSMNIKFDKIDLERTINCTGDHVRIYEKNKVANKDELLGIFCGNLPPGNIQSAGNEVIVHFQTDKKQKELNGFSLQYNSNLEVCGGTIEASEGSIQSPSYPIPHKSFRICQWYLKVPRGRRITVKIEDFDLDSRLIQGWLNGLAFYNENNRGLLTRLSVNNQQQNIESCENHMFVYYWATAGAGRGFKLKFTSNEPTQCIGDLNQASGIITAPNIDYPYYCSYIRENQSPGTTLSLTIAFVTNDTKKNCHSSTLLALVESEQAKQPLSRTLAQCALSKTVVRSPYSSLKVSMMQYFNSNAGNYTISFNTFSCGGILTSETGTIKSPGYPNKYPKNLECTWLLKLPPEQAIILTFENLELGGNCEQSYLDIYNGDSPSSPKFDRYCQKNKPDPIHSQTNSLWIEYNYDQSSSAQGFSLKYEPKIQGCGGIFHDQDLIIQSPSFPADYPNNAECLWELRSDQGYHIGLTFTTRFQIEESEMCENDFIEIWDWRNNEWYSLGKKCGREFPDSINSTSSRMKILFRTNNKVTGKGFRAQWNWNCGGTFVVDSTERFIVSPGFPIAYKNNMNCEYNISVPEAVQFFIVKFYNFDLDGTTSSCKHDNLTLNNLYNSGYSSSSLFRRVFCGDKIPPMVRLNYIANLQFKTDQSVQKSGFKFSYQLDSCDNKIASPRKIASPVLNIPRTLGLYNTYGTCVWNITAPPKKMVVIQFDEFRFEHRENCYYDNLQIYKGSDTDASNRIANLCGDLSKNLPVIKTDNSALLVMTVDRSGNYSGFKAEVFFVDGPTVGCGGKITLNDSTILTAPNLQDMDCSWMIISEVGTKIKVHFDELNLPMTCGLTNHSHTNCSCSSLEIKDGHPDVAETIEKFCGVATTNFARELTSSTHKMGIRLRTRGVNTRAFKITLRTVPSICGPVFLNVTKDIKTLISPGYPNKYPSDTMCTWVLQSNQKFMLHFVDFDLREENNQHVLGNNCGTDKMEIMDKTATHAMTDNLNYDFVLSGSKKQFTDYSTAMTGTHQFCGKSDVPFDYYSQSSSIVVRFSSANLDGDRGKGFKLEYHETDCNRNYTSWQGRIVSDFGKDCFQTITAPKNYTISVFFQSFNLYPPVPNCASAGFEIREGDNKTGNQLLKACSYGLPSPIYSTSNKLLIHSWNKGGSSYVGDYDIVFTSSVQGRGCGGILYNYRGLFSSPMYPMGYKSSTPCEWDVRVPIGMRVALKFTTFDIQGECEKNYVKVTTYEREDGNYHTFCPNDDPALLYSSSHVLVTYQSSPNNAGAGWTATFEALSV